MKAHKEFEITVKFCIHNYNDRFHSASRIGSCNHSGECRPCPPRSITHGEEVCLCDYRYEQLHTDLPQLKSTSKFK